MKLSTICEKIDFYIEIKEDINIETLAPLDIADSDSLSYCMGKKYYEDLKNTKAAAVFLKKRDLEYIPQNTIPLVVDNPELQLAYASELFKFEITDISDEMSVIHKSAKIYPTAFIAGNVKIGKNSIIMPNVFIGENVEIGDNTVIHPNVVIYQNTKIGNNCTIQANTTIGSDGFGFAHTADGKHIKIQHTGYVSIEDDVEIGTNTSIDRAVFKVTRVGKGSKIDNLVEVSHNVTMGENCLIAGQTGLAGSASLGKNVVMAAQTGSVGHIHIADFSVIAARGGVTKNTEVGKTYAGFPIREHKNWLREQAKILRLVKS